MATAGPLGGFEPLHVCGFGVPDLVFVRDGRAFLMTAPIYIGSVRELSGAPTTIVAARPIPGWSGDRDAVALLSASGVSRWSLDIETGLGTHTVVNSQVTGQTLHVGQAGGAVLTAVSDGSAVTLVDLESGVAVVRTYTASVLDAVFVDVDGSGDDELCVITSDSILVESATASLTHLSVAYAGNTTATAHRLRTGSGDRVVVHAQKNGASTRELVVLEPDAGNPLGATPALHVQAGLPAAPGFSVGDATLDGFDEVGYLDLSGHTELLYNLRPLAAPPAHAFQYTWFGGVRVDQGFVPSGSDAIRPAIADLDGDGDGEMVVGNPTAGSAVVNVNDYVVAYTLEPLLDGPGVESGGVLTFPVLVQNFPAEADELEVLGFELRAIFDGGQLRTALMPRGSHQLSIPLTDINPVQVSVPVEAGRSGSAPAGSRHLGYMFIVRGVDTSGASRRPYPAMVIAYVEDELDGPKTITPLPLPPPPPPPDETPTPGEGEG